MPRAIVLGNGHLCLGMDGRMQIRDFTYPLVGLENHAVGHAFRIGVWVDGRFSWIDSDDWEISMRYLPETLVSKCVATNKRLQVLLEVNDAVYSFQNLYIKKIYVKNLAGSSRSIRLFFSHDFHMYGEDLGETALFEPMQRAVIHYKRKRYFLINGLNDRGEGISEYAIGQKESFGKEGTWKDAEDGVLAGYPVAQGSVDSTVAFNLVVDPNGSRTVYYWIACGKNLETAVQSSDRARTIGVEQLLLETENYWSAWVNKQNLNLSVLPKDLIRLFKTSLLVLRTHVDNNGAIIASCDSDVLQFNRDTYSYVWPRDASICAMAFDVAGFQEVSKLIFEFCNRVITNEGFLRHKYWPDGSVGSSWHALANFKGQTQLPIQLDETALVVRALWKHFEKYRDIEFLSSIYPKLVLRSSEFMLNFRDSKTGLPKPTFDMWEERFGVFASTSACVCSALSGAANFAKVFYDSSRQEKLDKVATDMKQAIRTNLYDDRLKRFIKAIYPDGQPDTTIDSSLAFTFLVDVFDPENQEVRQTMEAVYSHLWVDSGIGGLARYQGDNYHRATKDAPGNPWVICTLWLARWRIKTAGNLDELKKGLSLLSWVAKYASPSGILAEQLNPVDGSPISVSPLVWSHAEFIIAVSEYLDKYRQLTSG